MVGPQQYKNVCHGDLEIWQVCGDRQPHLIQVHTEVIVNQLVSHPRNRRPGDLCGQSPRLGREAFYGFANDFQLPNDPVLEEALGA